MTITSAFIAGFVVGVLAMEAFHRYDKFSYAKWLMKQWHADEEWRKRMIREVIEEKWPNEK